VSQNKITVDELIKYVEWCDNDHALLLLVEGDVKNGLNTIMDSFYKCVLDNVEAAELIKNANSSVDNLKNTLREWIMDLISNNIDKKTFQKQNNVGIRHVEVGLPQSFMVLGINNMRSQIIKVIEDKYVDDINMLRKTVDALNKALDIRLSIMLRSYQDDRDRLVKKDILSENESMLALGRMSTSIAHEIKNPLAGISGAIQVLKGKLPSDSDDFPLMDAVLEQVNRMSGTVKDLLDFARPVQLNLQNIVFSEIIDSLNYLFAADPNYNMTVNYADEVTKNLVINVDPVRIQSVFYNIFINANEAIKQEGVITLSSEVAEDLLHIYIQDNGPGIPEEWVEELFKPFATNKTHGTGLGLAICAKIVESHSGMITYSPEISGARFCISLPKR